MNKSKKLYKSRITRKYIEFYGTDPLLWCATKRTIDLGIPFATYIKNLIRDDIKRASIEVMKNGK